MHVGFVGMAVAVAVDREAVHDVDVGDARSLPERVGDGFAGFAHGLEEMILHAAPGIGAALSRGVEQALAGTRGEADGNVLDRAAESGHGVTLEVRQHQIGIEIGESFADKVFFQMDARRGQRGVAFFVEDRERSDGRETVIFRDLIVHGRLGARTVIGRVALHNGAAREADHVGDQFRPQIVACRRLAGTQLDGDPPCRRPVQGLVGPYHSFRRDALRHVDGGDLLWRRGENGRDERAQNHQPQQRGTHEFLHPQSLLSSQIDVHRA